MKNLTIWFLALAALGSFSCKDQAPKQFPVEDTPSREELVRRGAYLVTIIGCADCHTPKKMTEKGPVFDMDRYMMGYDASQPLPEIPDKVPLGPWIVFNGELTAAAGPWGVSFAGNLTPDETGLGTWTLEQFSKALREGKYKGLDNSRPLMPPMPVEGFKHLTDQDLEAIFVYLKSLKPIDNVVPAYRPPGPQTFLNK
jgi:mono/diheme cytochrome c family protein